MASTKLYFCPSAHRWILAAATFVVVAGLLGCDTGPADSLFDPNRQLEADPVIAGIEPADQSLAGIGTITITGENFSTVPEENLVYFDGTRATVLEASATELTVRSPNLPEDDIDVKVAVAGAANISNVLPYALAPAVERFGAITDFEEVFGIATDEEGNLYMSLFSSNVSAGIKRLTPDGTRSDYAPSSFKWDALGLDAQGYLYGVRNVRAVFRFPPGGGAEAETWAVADDRSARFRSLAVDAAGNIWVGGSGANIYRVNQDGELTATPVETTVTALAATGGFLYVGEEGPPARVVRRPIQADGSLGAAEEVFTAPEGVAVLSIAIAASGEVLVGTDAPDPIYLVNVDGSSEIFYPDLLLPTAAQLKWGMSPYLFMVRGREAGESPDLIRINAQRERAE